MSNTTEEILTVLQERNSEALTADGFDEGLIGVIETHDHTTVALYSRAKCIEVIQKDGCSYEDAVEHFEFNVAGAYVGENGPLFAEIFE